MNNTRERQQTNNKQVYLFGTCLIDVFYPHAGLDAVALLELCGYEVIFPQAQTCCGQPPYNSGYEEACLDVVKNTVRSFSEKQIPLIVPSASCAGMIKHHYPKLLSKDSQTAKAAANLANRTQELIDFLVEQLPYEQLTAHPPCKVSLHESCSAQREMKVAQSWREVLKRMPNIEITVPPQHEECCGFGGTFAVKSDAISALMTEDKCKNLMASRPDNIVSGDCGCLMNLGEHIKFNGVQDPCLHLASFIAKQFGIHHDA